MTKIISNIITTGTMKSGKKFSAKEVLDPTGENETIISSPDILAEGCLTDSGESPLPLSPESPPTTQNIDMGGGNGSLYDESASVIMGILPDDVKRALLYHATNQHLKPWQLISGLLFYCYQNGLLTSPIILPGWLAITQLSEASGICKNCGKQFIPKYLGQDACSNKCGVELRNRDKRKVA